jgi:hypothetical protein
MAYADDIMSTIEDPSLLTDLAEDGDVAVVALRIVLQHWISWSKPAVVPRAVEKRKQPQKDRCVKSY